MAGNLDKDAQDQKDYQDYLDYQKYMASQAGTAAPTPSLPEQEAEGKRSMGGQPDPMGGPDIYGATSSEEGRTMLRNLPSQVVGAASGALPGVATGLGGLADLAANSATGAGTSGLAEYLRPGSTPESTLGAAKWGGGLSAAGQLLGGFLKGSSNSAMKSATGVTGRLAKQAPADIGTRMIEEEIGPGTRTAMAGDVAEKYARSEQDVQDLADQLQGEASPRTITDAVANQAKRHQMPGGEAIPGHEADLGAVNDRVQKLRNLVKGSALPLPDQSPTATHVQDPLATEGQPEFWMPSGRSNSLPPGSPSAMPEIEMAKQAGTPPTQLGDQVRTDLGTQAGLPFASREPGFKAKALLALKRGGDFEAFTNSGDRAKTTAAGIGAAQAAASRQALSEMSEGAMPAALRREQTLLLANKGLSAPDVDPYNPSAAKTVSSMAGQLAVRGAPTAGLAAKAGRGLFTSLPLSTYAHAADPLAELAKTNPAALTSLFENLPQSTPASNPNQR